MKTVPYAGIRIVAGALAAAWCAYVFVTEGGALSDLAGIVFFAAGWVVARRFGRPVGLSGARPWLDTVLPIALAAFAAAPAALYPFLGQIAIAPTAAVFVLFFAGMSFSLGLGPYANVKVALAR